MTAPSALSVASGASAAVLSLDVSTVDKYQGRDKDVIILSTVRQASSPSPSSTDGDTEESPMVGDLLRDWRRINVAITRARVKLVIVGSGTTLSHVPLLAELVNMVKDKNWHVQMPEDALEMYSHVLLQSDDQTNRSGEESQER